MCRRTTLTVSLQPFMFMEKLKHEMLCFKSVMLGDMHLLDQYRDQYMRPQMEQETFLLPI